MPIFGIERRSGREGRRYRCHGRGKPSSRRKWVVNKLSSVSCPRYLSSAAMTTCSNWPGGLVSVWVTSIPFPFPTHTATLPGQFSAARHVPGRPTFIAHNFDNSDFLCSPRAEPTTATLSFSIRPSVYTFASPCGSGIGSYPSFSITVVAFISGGLT